MKTCSVQINDKKSAWKVDVSKCFTHYCSRSPKKKRMRQQEKNNKYDCCMLRTPFGLHIVFVYSNYTFPRVFYVNRTHILFNQ